jgi:hypothetical protein
VFTIAVLPTRSRRAGADTVAVVWAQVYHPNIDMAGHVCLNILRDDWKPVLALHAVISGLLFLFNEPNPNDPLNHGTWPHVVLVAVLARVCVCL